MKHGSLMLSDVYEAKTHEYLSSSPSYLFPSLEVLQLRFISIDNSGKGGVGCYSTSLAADVLIFPPIDYFQC